MKRGRCAVRQDGPLLAGAQRAFRVGGFVVAQRRAGQLFGYERGQAGRRPALIGAIVARLHGEIRYAAWEQVESLGDDVWLGAVGASGAADRPVTGSVRGRGGMCGGHEQG
jgi:hypothetical protein